MKTNRSWVHNIFNRPVARKLLTNSSWLVVERIVQMLIGLFVTAIIARYFGTEQFGLFNYAVSIVALFTSIANLGLETLTVKAIVDKKEDEGKILGTTFLLQVIGGFLLVGLSTTLSRVLNKGDASVQSLVLIYSFVMVFKSFETIEYWIQAYQLAKVSVPMKLAVHLLTAGLKLMMVAFERDLRIFALIYVLDSVMLLIGYFLVYYRNRSQKSRWFFDITYAKKVLKRSKHFILSGMMVALYMQMDKIMLGNMLSNKEMVGLYSAATSVSQMWYFIPFSLIRSFRPLVLRQSSNDRKAYHKSLMTMFIVITWISIFFAIGISIFSRWIILIIYGEEFVEAASILKISVWSGIFAIQGSARGVWIVSEGLEKHISTFIAAGAAINIVLNYILLPVLEGNGAAIATLISQMTVAILAPLLIPKTRPSAIMLLKSFNPAGLLQLWKENV